MVGPLYPQILWQSCSKIGKSVNLTFDGISTYLTLLMKLWMTPLVLVLIFAICEWIGEYLQNQRLIFLTKPAVMVCLIAWVWAYTDFPSLLANPTSFPLVWFVIALAFCLAGDVFLMLPPERFFLPGLIGFLIGHVFYIIGFGGVLPPANSYAPGLIIAGLVLLVALTIYRKLLEGMIQTGTERMKIPVTVYSVIITLMLYAALTTLLRDEWHYSAAWLVSFGALSFYLSDILNAWVRFRAPIPAGRLKIVVTYHLGQIALAAGAALHFMLRTG